METPLYLALKSYDTCTASKFGTVPVEDRSLMINNSIRHEINESCGNPLLKTSTISCPRNVDYNPNPPFAIGPVTNPVIYFGEYSFDVEKPNTIDADEIQSDIDTYPNNYLIGTLGNSVFTIYGNYIHYPTFRVPVANTLTIKDEGGIDITSQFTVYTNATDRFYILEVLTSPSSILYNLTVL